MENFTLRDYQSVQLAFHIQKKKSLNLSDPGTGKTPTACLFIQYIVDVEHLRVAFVMPKSLLDKNLKETLRFTGLQENQVKIVSGLPPKKREDIYKNPDVKVYLMGFDNFSAEFNKLPRDFGGLVVDEFHMGYKTNDSKRTQAFYAAVNRCKFFLGMSGTLIDGRLDSAYPAIRACSNKYYGSYKEFIAQHAYVDEYGHVLEWYNHDKIKRILGREAVKMRFKDAYKNSPEPVIIAEECQIDKNQLKLYKEFEAEALLELEDKFITDSGSGGVHQMRCRQILECPEALEIPVDFSYGKDERLKVHLEDAVNSKKPLLIFSVFVAEQQRLAAMCSNMGLRTAIMNGNTSDSKRAEIDKAFRNGKIDVVIGSPAVMSVGFNWQHVDTVIFVSIDYMDSNFKQAIQRADRGTRSYPLTVYRMYYPVKVEARLWDIIKRKKSDSEKVGW